MDLEIEMDELGSLPLYPPRRRLLDFLPTFIMSWIRRKWNRPKITPRESWAVKSLMLRVAYNTQRVAGLIDTIPTPFYLSEAKTKPPLQELQEVIEDVEDDDPWRWS